MNISILLSKIILNMLQVRNKFLQIIDRRSIPRHTLIPSDLQ